MNVSGVSSGHELLLASLKVGKLTVVSDTPKSDGTCDAREAMGCVFLHGQTVRLVMSKTRTVAAS